MWQHRWAVWGGVLGASASCLAKLAVSGESPLQRLQTNLCPPEESSFELDDWIMSHIYKIVGDLMIRHRINLMAYVQAMRSWIQDAAVRLYIFEVDWCKVLFLGPRLILLVVMLIMNAYMIAAFLKGMQHSGSVVGTAITTACNFSMSAIWGYWVWEERFSSSWWVGFSCVLLGVLILSSIQQPENDIAKDKARVHKSSNSGGVTVRGSDVSVPNSVSRKYGKAMEAYQGSIDTSSYRGGRPSTIVENSPKTGSRSSVTSSKELLELQMTAKPPPPTQPPTPKTTIKPNRAVIQKQQRSITTLVDRSVVDVNTSCPLCTDPLFDKDGNAEVAVADLSPSCHHVMHARCLKYRQKHDKDSACPICQRNVSMFVSARECAHFAGFWIKRVETCLKRLGPAEGGKPQPAAVIREKLAKDSTLTDAQKIFIHEDPTGLGKGLQSALEWGGSVDHNEIQKGRKDWNACLKTRGIWTYSPRHDDLWLWEWGIVHPRQRCEQCQFVKELPVICNDCQGSAEVALYCSEACQKRDRQRHKMTCQTWQQRGPPAK